MGADDTIISVRDLRKTFTSAKGDSVTVLDCVTFDVKRLIATIACYQGLNVSGGAVGVGRSTTATVVQTGDLEYVDGHLPAPER